MGFSVSVPHLCGAEIHSKSFSLLRLKEISNQWTNMLDIASFPLFICLE